MFPWELSNFILKKKEIKMAESKKTEFFKIANSHGLFLGLEGLTKRAATANLS
jgi:hypothetical protein